MKQQGNVEIGQQNETDAYSNKCLYTIIIGHANTRNSTAHSETLAAKKGFNKEGLLTVDQRSWH